MEKLKEARAQLGWAARILTFPALLNTAIGLLWGPATALFCGAIVIAPVVVGYGALTTTNWLEKKRPEVLVRVGKSKAAQLYRACSIETLTSIAAANRARRNGTAVEAGEPSHAFHRTALVIIAVAVIGSIATITTGNVMVIALASIPFAPTLIDQGVLQARTIKTKGAYRYRPSRGRRAAREASSPEAASPDVPFVGGPASPAAPERAGLGRVPVAADSVASPAPPAPTLTSTTAPPARPELT